MKPIMLIMNPNAGKGGFRASLADILSGLYGAGYLPTVFFPEGQEAATALVAARAHEYDRVVCAGGDGTLSAVVSGLVQVPNPPVLGYLPMGTANDVARTLGLSTNPATALQTLINGREIPLDVGRFGQSEHFTYIAAFGAFTEASYRTSHEAKQALGLMAYVLDGIGRLGGITPHTVRVEYDGGVIEDELIFGAVTNSMSVAGLVKLTPNSVALNDGLFEVILVKNPRTAADAGAIVSKILSSSFDGPFITMLHCKSVHFSFWEPVAWTRDGDDGGRHTDITLENLPSAIRILVD